MCGQIWQETSGCAYELAGSVDGWNRSWTRSMSNREALMLSAHLCGFEQSRHRERNVNIPMAGHSFWQIYVGTLNQCCYKNCWYERNINIKELYTKKNQCFSLVQHSIFKWNTSAGWYCWWILICCEKSKYSKNF